MINYIFYTIVSLGCAYGVYHMVLKKQKTFQFNRFFLLGTLLLSLMAPLLEINMFETIPSITEISLEPSVGSVVSHEVMKGETVSEFQNSSDSIFNMLCLSYNFIVLCI